MVLAGMAVAAVVSGSAAAASPVLTIPLQARLAPVAGAEAAGSFRGFLVKFAEPQRAGRWLLSWRVSLPASSRASTVSLRVPARDGSTGLVRTLCRRCSSAARGALTLTNGQALGLGQTRATVVARTASTLLRGTVKAQAKLPPPTG